jgi:predicted transcriptional regulator
MPQVSPVPTAGWTFLTNHTHVLLCLYRNPEITLRQVATLVGITERMVQKIVAELVEAGYLAVTKIGRCNTYQITLDKALRHPLESHRSIGDMLQNLNPDL